MVGYDEFITPTDSSIYETLQTFKEKYDNLGGIAVNWCMYGNNHIDKLDNHE